VSPRSWLAVTAAFVVVADQISKAVALATLQDGDSVRVIDGVLHWTLQRNPGAAFGIFRRAPALFTVLAIVIAAAIIVASPRARDRLNGVALGLVLGGALGNLVDRLFRPPGPFRGRVIDFIDFRVWPTFNLADSAVVIGALLLAIASFRSDRERPRRDPSIP
jgi:signal peptidase II